MEEYKIRARNNLLSAKDRFEYYREHEDNYPDEVSKQDELVLIMEDLYQSYRMALMHLHYIRDKRLPRKRTISELSKSVYIQATTYENLLPFSGRLDDFHDEYVYDIIDFDITENFVYFMYAHVTTFYDLCGKLKYADEQHIYIEDNAS